MNEGKKDRRDPIRTIKAKNPVAKNANKAIGGGAAGAHKDKKAAEKKGEVKHKKQEYAESLQDKLDSVLAEGGYNYNQPDPVWVTINGKRWKWFFNYVSGRKAMDTLNAKFRKEGSNKKADWEPAELEDNPDYGIKVGEAMNGITGPGMIKDPTMEAPEEFDSPEYNDEAGMAEGNLLTLARAVKGLYDTIEDDDNLPEWCQEKIAKAEMMLVSVWDYLLSQKDQGIDPKVSEASALEKFRKGSAEREKKHADAEADIKKLPPEKRSGAAIDRLEKHVNAKEGWTHDSLADELFEHERTYEDKLQNQLDKLTKR
jgi:hypothetical protein